MRYSKKVGGVPMTTAVGLICADGLAVGTDMKVTAGDMKYTEAKLLTTAKLGERALLIAGSGVLRHIKDAVGWLHLSSIIYDAISSCA